MKILLTFFLIILTFQLNFAQYDQYDEDNWLGDMGYAMDMLRQFYPNKFYAKEDVIKAKNKLSMIKNAGFNDEWEGYYQHWGELNQYGLIWNSTSGFIHYNIYTCNIELRGLWFGDTVNLTNSLKLNYENKKLSSTIKKNIKQNQTTYIKVKIGEKHFLVPPSRLKDFCEYAVGLDYFPEEGEQYWWKVEDSKKEISGLPILPENYKHFLRYPIETKIISLGKREFTYITYEGKKEPHSVRYFVIINKGKINGVTNQMDFYIPELKERVYVEKVFQHTSLAVITRELDENSNEKCNDDNYQEQPCHKIVIGINAITKIRF